MFVDKHLVIEIGVKKKNSQRKDILPELHFPTYPTDHMDAVATLI